MIHEMMKDIFNHKMGMQTNYFIDPFTLKI